MDSVDQHFQQFLRERIYLHDVAPKTSEWYRDVWHVFQPWWATLPSREQTRTVISRRSSPKKAFVFSCERWASLPTKWTTSWTGLAVFTCPLSNQQFLPKLSDPRPIPVSNTSEVRPWPFEAG